MAADAEASIVPTLAASASANSLARIPCHPIDTIKAKLQVQGKATGLGSSSVTGGPLSAARTVLRTEGVGGLYSGIGITILGVRAPSHPRRTIVNSLCLLHAKLPLPPSFLLSCRPSQQGVCITRPTSWPRRSWTQCCLDGRSR
jgi:hypothetical protein